MRISWKRFVEWGIDLRRDNFQIARLKLSVFLTIFISLILIVYIGFLYSEFNRSISSFARENIPEKDRRERFIVRSETVTKRVLFGVEPEDVLIVVITIFVSYFIAGFALEPIRKTMRAQKQFMADASHELRTPLAIIKTEMEVFLRDRRSWIKSDKFLLRKRKSIVSNLEEVDRMQQIIDNLVFLSRTDIYKEKFQFVSFDLSSVLNSVVQRLEEQAKTKRISLSLKGNTPIPISGDPIRLEQAFLNILQNAIKYTGEKGRVQIVVDRSVKKVNVSITDSGIGIAAKDLPHIFDRFFRSSNKYVRGREGVGLGLPIANLIVKEHEGTIKIHSRLKQGTTATVSLSLAS